MDFWCVRALLRKKTGGHYVVVASTWSKPMWADCLLIVLRPTTETCKLLDVRLLLCPAPTRKLATPHNHNNRRTPRATDLDASLLFLKLLAFDCGSPPAHPMPLRLLVSLALTRCSVPATRHDQKPNLQTPNTRCRVHMIAALLCDLAASLLTNIGSLSREPPRRITSKNKYLNMSRKFPFMFW